MRSVIDKKPAFLAAFKACASVSVAARAVKMDRGNHYDWIENDPEYAKAFARAKEEATQTLEDEAVRRAHEGVEKPLAWQGRFSYPPEAYGEDGKLKRGAKPYAMREYSDALLMFLLRGARPEKYRTGVEVTGANGGLVETALTVTFVRPKD